MKHATGTIFIILFCLTLGTITSLGQAKEITKAEFEAARTVGYSVNRGTFPRRESWTRERFGSSDKTTEILEFYGADSIRSIYVSKGIGKLESVQIGNVFYMRQNDGQWEKSDSGYSRRTVSSQSSSRTDENYTVETLSENGRLFQYIKKFDEAVSRNGFEQMRTERFWIDGDGRLGKHELEYADALNQTVLIRSFSVYEFGVKLPPLVAPIK